MCSSLTQLVFGVVMLGAIALTLGATFSDKWRTVEKDLLDLYEDVQRNHTERLTGILPFLCEDGAVGCAGFWKEMKPYEKIVAICMIAALILEIVAFVWNFLTSCTCCFKKYLLHPLSPLSFLITIFLTVAIGVFYYNSDEIKDDVNIQKIWDAEAKDLNINIGSAFWMAVGAWCLVVIDTILASFAIFFAQHGV
ncbi:CLaudin-like in Caenorhabditis [Caenorhabditis elegans]|uniref:CLaudin-like in Caenorhabditis n=1 Tax=Caenorhabditis elegans TaxID=6239 RepID=Q22191_CAEEL|nr:CLaudin-like in Caenorhabditis [Caenorhabditis elegans]CAA92134.1 CLaudin-like in Caenorhabditis [Caenorhabditis elegans]|eukprot:NP_509800.1 CLaudin-like in Caenorhabditis [Caenorhabditis elegans]